MKNFEELKSNVGSGTIYLFNSSFFNSDIHKENKKVKHNGVHREAMESGTFFF